MRALTHRPDIDGLRALAILWVLGFHAFPEALPGGFTGVDVFFVISGYLITQIIALNLAAGRFSFAAFYARRVRRILPALLLVLAATLALGWALLGPEDRRQLSAHALAGTAFVSNFLLWREAGYFDAAGELKPLLHLWSLAIEEQFYLLWPLLVYLAWRARISLALVAALVGGASFLIGLHAVVNDPDGAFYSPAGRFWELMLGCFLAAREASGALRAQTQARADAQAAAGLALIVAGAFLLDRHSAFPGIWALMPTLGAALLLQSPRAWINRRLFSQSALVALGLVSYALYLWHWPLLAFLHLRYAEGAPAALRLAAVLLALALAWITYAVLERPVRRQSRGALVPALLGLCGLTAATALAGYRAEPATEPLLEAKLLAALAWPPRYEADPACRARHPAATYCAIARPGEPPTHALIGDSHANQFFPGLAEAIGNGGGNLIHFGGAGCAPLYGLESSDTAACRAIIDRALDLVLADQGIRTVILAANWHPYVRGRRFSAYQNRQAPRVEMRSAEYPEARDSAALVAAALQRTVGRLVKAGKRVILVRQAPELAIRFETCLEKLRAGPWGAWEPRACAVPRRSMDAYLGEYTALFDAALAGVPGVRILDPVEALCDRDLCHAVGGGELLYRDAVHLSVAGSRYVAARLWPALQSAR